MDGRVRRDGRRDAEPPRHVHDVALAHLHADPDRDEVSRFVEPLSQGHGAHELQVVVLGRPVGAIELRQADRRVVDERQWRIAVLDGGRVHDRLERRPRLPHRLRGTIELRVVVVTPAHHRPDAAIARIDCDERGLQVRRLGATSLVAVTARHILLVRQVPEGAEPAPFDRAQLALDGPFGGRLHVEVERRVDLEPLFIQPVAEAFVQRLPHPLGEVGRDLAGLHPARQRQGIGLRQAGLLVVDDAFTAHQLDDRVAALHGTRGKPARVVTRRSLRDRRQRCRFGDIQVTDRLPEVALGGRFHTVRAGAEVDLVEVQLEDLVLRIPPLDPPGNLDLLQLPDRRFFARQLRGKDVARQLHRDGGETFHEASRPQVRQGRAGHAQPVDPAVAVEALVLRDDEGLAHHFRNFLEGGQGAALQTEFRHETSVNRIQPRCLARLVALELFDGGTARPTADEVPRRQTESEDERHRGGDDITHPARRRRVVPGDGCYTTGDPGGQLLAALLRGVFGRGHLCGRGFRKNLASG